MSFSVLPIRAITMYLVSVQVSLDCVECVYVYLFAMKLHSDYAGFCKQMTFSDEKKTFSWVFHDWKFDLCCKYMVHVIHVGKPAVHIHCLRQTRVTTAYIRHRHKLG